jgi:hypothetical protein
MPEIDPKKKPKSDLTLKFMDSSDFVHSLALQSERTKKIDQMRQSAVINQPARPKPRYSKIASTRGRLHAMEKLASYPSMANPNRKQITCQSSQSSLSPFPRSLNRTMTTGNF